MESHLLQMRGLKQNMQLAKYQNNWSHLLQMRGLKPCGWCVNCRQNKSHLLQMRGLKRYTLEKAFGNSVASFTDAWIET